MATSLYATDGGLGADFNAVFTPPSSGAAYPIGDQAPFAVGTRMRGSKDSEWVYVLYGSGGATGAGYVCRINEDFTATMCSTSNETYGDAAGVPPVAASEGDYGWLQIKGPCVVRVAASANANVDLVATGTAGELDDGVTTGIFVKGLVLTTANGGSAGTAAAYANFPVFDTLYEPET